MLYYVKVQNFNFEQAYRLYAVGRTGCTPLGVQSVLVQTAKSVPLDSSDFQNWGNMLESLAAFPEIRTLGVVSFNDKFIILKEEV